MGQEIDRLCDVGAFDDREPDQPSDGADHEERTDPPPGTGPVPRPVVHGRIVRVAPVPTTAIGALARVWP